MDLIYGRHPVLEALRSTTEVRQVWVLASEEASGTLHDVMDAARAGDIPVHFVPRIALDRKAEGGNHQGVVAEVGPYRYYDLDFLVQRATDRGELPFLLLLDHLKDVHNFGAILRTAEAAGVHGVIIPERRSVRVTATVYKTSAGAVNYIPVAQVTNLVKTMQTLKEYGLWLAGLAADGDVTYDDADLGGPLGVVVGEEGTGLSRLVRDNCDLTVRLPVRGRVDSLNASVAAGILMYTALRQRERL